MPLFSHKNMLSTLRNNYPIRKEFQDGYNKITRHTNLKEVVDTKYLVHAFCGTGKSRLITHTTAQFLHTHANIKVLCVFPSLTLIKQFCNKNVEK